MITSYFDRNVFADICDLRNGVSAEDVEVLKSAINKNLISIPLSGAHLGETLALVEQSEELVIKHLETIRDIADKNGMIKHAEIILLDDCVSYARQLPTRHIIPESISFNNINQNLESFLKFAERHKKLMDLAAENITQRLLESRELIEVVEERQKSDFINIWKVQAVKSVENLITNLSEKDRKKCRKRGINNMLKIKSVLIHSIYTSWFFYSGQFGIQGSPRKVRRNDLLDLIHSIQASATDIFVTQENPNKSGTIPFILNQFQIPNFRLMNLQQFIEFLTKDLKT